MGENVKPTSLREIGASEESVTLIGNRVDFFSDTKALPPHQYGASLLVISGAHAGRSIPIDAPRITIGRTDECDLRLNLPDVSRRHAAIICNAFGEYEVEDLQSRNGTTVNGLPAERQVLRYGDRIGIGRQAHLLFTHYDELGELLLQRQRIESIGALAGGVAHDFNNLLGAILANVNALMADQNGRPAGDDEVLSDIRAATIRASDLTSQLLAFARRGQYEQQPTSIAKICHEALRLARRTFGPRVEIVSNIDAKLVVVGDASQLHQVVMNLLINGRDAMIGGGRLTLIVNRAPGREVIGLDATIPYVRIQVRDTGPGMDIATQQRVFEPFFTTKALGQGTGLGLATAYGIVRNHGGDIRVDSEVGRGSTFEVYLPLHSTQAVEQPETEDIAVTYSPEDLGVLVIDDDLLFVRALERMLTQSGFRLVTARSGPEALDLLKTSTTDIHIVFLDVLMPNMGGRAVFERLRAICHDLPIILISGYSDSGDAQQMMRNGAAGFLRKPVSLEQVHAAIEQAIADQRWRADTPANAVDS
ncbi:MAG: response regulator [Myxococcota bacterium]